VDNIGAACGKQVRKKRESVMRAEGKESQRQMRYAEKFAYYLTHGSYRAPVPAGAVLAHWFTELPQVQSAKFYINGNASSVIEVTLTDGVKKKYVSDAFPVMAVNAMQDLVLLLRQQVESCTYHAEANNKEYYYVRRKRRRPLKQRLSNKVAETLGTRGWVKS
jgi:hypothetical protein